MAHGDADELLSAAAGSGTSVAVISPPATAEAQSNGPVRGESARRQPTKRALRTQQHAKAQCVRVGGLQERHASWRDLALYLSFYMHATQTRIDARETVSFSQQNAVLQAARGEASGRRQRLFPESADAYACTFACRGPLLRREDPSGHKCPFRFVAHVEREHDAWRIVVPASSQHCFHNHAVVGGLRVPRSVAASLRTSMKQFPTQQRAGDAVVSTVDLPQVLESECENESVNNSHASEPEKAQQQAHAGDFGADRDRDEDGAACEDDGAMDVTLETNEAQRESAAATATASVQQSLRLVQEQQGFPVKEYYESWDELLGVVDEYMHVTCTKLVLRASCSVAKHNKTVSLDSTRRARKQIRSGGNQHLELVPETWKIVSRQFGCTHDWTSTYQAQSLRANAAATRPPSERCQFRVRAIVVKVDNAWRIHLPVHLQNRVHNHSLRTLFSLASGDGAVQYPSTTAPILVPDLGSQTATQAQPHRHQVTNTTTGLPLPPTHLKEYYDSWDDFFAYLRAYVHSTKSNIVIKHTTSVSSRNQEILASGHADYLLPESLKMFAHQFGCSSQAEGHPGAECPFRLTAHVIKVNDVWCIHVPISLQSCRHDHTGSSAVVMQSHHEPVVAANANLLDIRTIPRDHPLYDAICELASRQHRQQEQTMTLGLMDSEVGVLVASTPSIAAHDTRLHPSVHQIPTQVVSVEQPHSQYADTFADSESSLIHGESVANRQSMNSNDEDDAEETGDGQVMGDGSNALGDVTGGGHEVRVASLQEFHASWESFSMYLHEYMRETKTKIVIGGSTSVSKRNQQLTQTKRAQRSEASFLIPDELNVYYRRYICTHGSEKRVRSQGLRQTRHLRSTGCRFLFSAHAAKINNVWCVHVPLKSQHCVHNHPVEQEHFESYASFRTIPKVHPLYDEIQKMVLAGCDKTAKIYEFIRANSSFKVTTKDVRNMIQTIKKG